MTGPAIDPLADYRPDWRNPDPRVTDPLADYAPDWKTAAAMFGPLEEHGAVDPALLAGVTESAAAGVSETPFQSAYRKVARVGKQLAASLPEQATMAARDIAGTAAALGTAVLSPEPREALREGQKVRDVFDPALEAISGAAGEPRGIVEKAARMVGPLPLIGVAKIPGKLAARAARTAAEAAEMETLARIHAAPAIGEEVAAHRFNDLLTEPRTPNTEAVAGFSDALQEAQGARAAAAAAEEARLNAPRTENTQAVVDFDRQMQEAQARRAAAPAAPIAAVPEPEIQPITPRVNPPFEAGDALEDALADYTPEWREPSPTGAPDWLPDPLAHVPAKKLPPRNPKFGKMDDAALFNRRHALIERMDAANEKIVMRPYVRENQYGGPKHTGMVLGQKGDAGAAGRAIGRLKDDGRLIEELDQEFEARGIPPEDIAAAHDRYLEGKAEEAAAYTGGADEWLGMSGASGGRILGSMTAGGAAGAAAGGTQGDTPEERRRNALLGLGVGLVGGGIAGQARRVGPIERALEGRRAGMAGKRPAPGALSLFDQNPAQQDLLGERAGELAGSEVGRRPPEPIAEPRPAPIPQVPGQLELGAVGARRFVEPGARPKLDLTPPEGPIPDDYVNVEKFALDETGEARLRSEVTRIVKVQGIHPKQTVSWQETRSLANDIGLGDLPKEQINTRLNGPQMLAIRNIVSTNIEALDGLYQKVKAGGLTPDEVKTVDRSIGYLERENDQLLARFTKARTQTGRDLNNLKILANRVMDPFTWTAKAENLAAQTGRKLSPEERQRIRELIQAGDKEELVRFVAALRPPTVGSKVTTLWKTGLLTNPKTHVANILGNTAMAGLEMAKDLPASIADRILSIGTGQRTKSLAPIQAARATWEGAKAGTREAADIMRHGVPVDLTRWELPNEVTFKNPILDAYVQTIRRGLAAPDAFFRQVALRRALAEAERLGPLTEESALQAVADAEYAVFQGGGRQAGVQSRLAQAGEGLRKPLGAVGHVIAPFTRTPGNVIAATLDYSPFGALRGAKDVYRLVKAARAHASPTEIRALQKAASEQLGRTATGTGAAFLGGYLLAREGKMTGARPADAESQDQWDLAGKQENAVRLGNKWLSLNRLSPVGNLMALGANYYLFTQEPGGGPLSAATAALTSIGTTATEQSFLRGVQELTEAIKDPKKYGVRYAQNLVASTVPAIVGAVARGIDPTVRDTRQGFLDTFTSRMPGLSRTLPAQVNALGREKVRSGGIMGQLFDPTTAREYRLDDPVIRELEQTGATLGELNMGRARPAEQRKLEAALRNTRSPATRASIERRLERASEGESRPDYLIRSKVEGRVLNRVLQEVMRDQNYQRLPSEGRREVLEAVIAKVRRDLGQLRRKAGR